jgi:hypothetical protein
MVNRRALFVAAALPLAASPGRSETATGPDTRRQGTGAPEGAVADGASHPVSSRFRTIDDARATYPQAMSLSDELDWCALQAAIDIAEAQGSGAVHVPNTGRPYVLNRPLVVNPNRVTLHGDGSTLDFRTLRDVKGAILFRSDGAPPYGHERHVLEGFELIGPGSDPRIAGLLFATQTEALSSRAQIRDCAIHGFNMGIQFGDRAYGIGFSHVSVYDCTFCVYVPYNLRDAGETISFSQCYLFNSYCCISNGGAFDLKFFGCSLDYGKRLVWDNNGGIDLVGCRLEMAPPTEPPIHNNGGRLNMFGGFFLINGPRDAVHASEIFALSNASASVHLFGVQGWNWRTTTGTLTRGPGKIYWHAGSEITEVPLGIGHP